MIGLISAVIFVGFANSAGATRAGDTIRSDRLCEAIVTTIGCDSNLGSLGSSKSVREACPEHCGVYSVHGRGLQATNISSGVGCFATTTVIDLSCVKAIETWDGEYDQKQGCVDECMAAEQPLPLWFSLLTTLVLTCCSAFCSGLTLGLMGLDMTMLNVIKQSGNDIDKVRADKITPLRSTGNRLLCVLLITNTAVNAGLAIVMAALPFLSGFTGWLGSTLLIMIFGEITPQAICSRHGLAIGAALYPVIWLVCAVFYPLAAPIAVLLDAVLGQEIGLSYSRDELIALLSMHSISGRTEQGPQGDIQDTEAKILQGVLKFSGKIADDIYTPLKMVDCLGVHEKLDITVMNCIYKSGHSRIPVYRGKKDNIVGIVFIKDLVIVDPEDSIPVLKIVQYFDHKLPCVSKDIGLLGLLEQFMSGHAHMCVILDAPMTNAEHFVSFEVESSDENLAAGNRPRQLGIVTLEDLFEEMLTMQIHDEHDVFLLEHKNEPGHDAVVEKIVNQRSKAHIHEVPPKWLAHYGSNMSDEDYAANFTGHTLEELAHNAGAIDQLYNYVPRVVTPRKVSAMATDEFDNPLAKPRDVDQL